MLVKAQINVNGLGEKLRLARLSYQLAQRVAGTPKTVAQIATMVGLANPQGLYKIERDDDDSTCSLERIKQFDAIYGSNVASEIRIA